MKKIGMRNIKTAIAVFICISLFSILGRPYPFYACIAAVICMRATVYNSLMVGRDRMVGTIIGGIVGFVLSSILPNNALITAVGIVMVIYLCNIVNKKESSAISCIVLIAIMTNLKGNTPFVYASNRVIDTLIGIVVAVIVNKVIGRRDGEQQSA